VITPMGATRIATSFVVTRVLPANRRARARARAATVTDYRP
jgi:hypothetical protein